MRFVGVIGVFLLLTGCPSARAASVAQTLRQWGLIGVWALDCTTSPGKGYQSALSYEVEPDGEVIHRRDFGDRKSYANRDPVKSAMVDGDNMLVLKVYFTDLKQTREFGIVKTPDGGIRAMYNRSEAGEYTIKDGTVLSNNKPSAVQKMCK